jgi:hypothetical protein
MSKEYILRLKNEIVQMKNQAAQYKESKIVYIKRLQEQKKAYLSTKDSKANLARQIIHLKDELKRNMDTYKRGIEWKKQELNRIKKEG